MAFAKKISQALPHLNFINPWRHLGALGFLFFWLIAVTGFYLFAVLDTSVEGVYRSIDWLTREQWYLGGIIRSVHRYAADAFVVVTLLHLTREFLLGRYRGFRRFSWLTGIPLLWFVYISGIGGFWLNWDQLGQFSAVASAEWLDWLPIFATPFTRNFLTAGAVSDRLFTLLVFVHIGVPLLLIFGLWFHVQRINRAEVFPPRMLGVATFATLLVMAVLSPVVSQGPADLARVPGALALDWFYLFIHPLMYASSPAILWLTVSAITLFLLLLPFVPPSPSSAPAPVAVVDPDNCNGCRRCFDDCPYAAIVMVPHPQSTPGGQQLARVNADLCASCGICAGSCPSSTPFRSAATLATGIDMPQLPVDALRQSLTQQLANIHAEPKIAVFGCAQGAAVTTLGGPNVATISLICTGMLPPSFIEYALREGAAGVLVTGCRDSGCAFRLGSLWTEQRLRGQREPHLRTTVDPERVCIAWADSGEEATLRAALHEFQHKLRALPDIPMNTQTGTSTEGSPHAQI